MGQLLVTRKAKKEENRTLLTSFVASRPNSIKRTVRVDFDSCLANYNSVVTLKRRVLVQGHGVKHHKRWCHAYALVPRLTILVLIRLDFLYLMLRDWDETEHETKERKENIYDSAYFVRRNS